MISRAPRRVIPIAVQEPEEGAGDVDNEEQEEDIGDALASGKETDAEATARIAAKYAERATSPLRAIRGFCVACMGYYPREVAKCTATGCMLWHFRFGKNPYQRHSKKGT